MSKELPRHERRNPSPSACGSVDQCNLTLKTVLGFLSTRVLRGGPRLVIQVILALFALMLLGKFLTSPSSDLMTSGSRWSWSPFGAKGQKQDTVGGVRVVAFGSPDIATPSSPKGGKSWTEMLCEDLGCTAHHSFVPETNLPAQAVTLHEHYKSTIDKVTRELDQQKAPGYDYDFILPQFPLAEALSDLAAQVDAFLATPAPARPPRETVWVFSFGTWDVWTLATLPRELGQGIVDLMVRALFAQVERVYQAALDTSSPAFSDFWAYQNASLIEKLNHADKHGDDVDEREVENFRVVVPELFDVSLTPGWHAQRPAPPDPHTKAEQMTNAAHLTARWNSEVRGRLDDWMRTPDPQPAEGDERGQFGYVPASQRSVPRLRRGSPNDNKQDKATTAAAAAAEGDGEALRVPFPRRVGAQVNTAEFVREAIIERQMRQHRLEDANGRGNRSESAETGVFFAEAWTPCIWAKTSETPEAAGGYAACDTPGDYLFYSPFTLGERAIRETARRAGVDVREKLAFVDKTEEKEEQKQQQTKTKRSLGSFQRVLRPSRRAHVMDACPTLDVC